MDRSYIVVSDDVYNPGMVARTRATFANGEVTYTPVGGGRGMRFDTHGHLNRNVIAMHFGASNVYAVTPE